MHDAAYCYIVVSQSASLSVCLLVMSVITAETSQNRLRYCLRLTWVGPRNHALDGVKNGRIHLQPRGVTKRQSSLLPNYFGQ